MSIGGAELYEQILSEFERMIDDDKMLRDITAEIKDYVSVNLYAERLGTHLASAFKKVLGAADLPEGKVITELAEAAIRPMIENNRRLVNASAEVAQKALNASAGIGLNPVTPKARKSKVDGILTRLAEENYEDIKWIVDAPVRNITQSFVNDYVEENAKFQARAGLSPRITRKLLRPCCPWCAKMEGTYIYGEHPDDIFRRHENCDCQVLFEPPEGKKQDVHTKKYIDDENSRKIEERKQIGRNSR